MVKTEEVFVTTAAKVNFLKALIRLAKADGKVSEKERIFFIQAAQQLEVESQAEKEVDAAWNADRIEVSFETSREKMMALIQLYQISKADEEVAQSELSEIAAIAREMGISGEAAKAVDDWFRDGLAWANRMDMLLDMK